MVEYSRRSKARGVRSSTSKTPISVSKIELNHELTPERLSEINESICVLLAAKELDDKNLRLKVTQRDEFIQAHLQSLSTDERKAFANAELSVNNRLQATIKNLFTDSLSELSGLVRGMKAVKKYK